MHRELLRAVPAVATGVDDAFDLDLQAQVARTGSAVLSGEVRVGA